jgi:predicted nucleic acid-binding protein
MPRRWVINASPLIVLSKIEHQHLLTRLADEIAVPNGVVSEIEAGPPGDAARALLNSTTLQTAAVAPEASVIAWDLGRGETEVISFALAHPGWTAVIDDNMARRCARTLSIPIIGTLGVIILARQTGLIPAAAPVLQLLTGHGFRIDEQMVRQVLFNTVGERYP